MNIQVRNHPTHGVIHCQGLGKLIRETNLREADLRGADLSSPSLRETDLSFADLRWAKLRSANLSWANLWGADLSWANLRLADLNNADLRNADLTGTCLDPTAEIPPISDDDITSAGLEIVGDRVYGWRTRDSQHVGSTTYEPGKCYTAQYFSIADTECHPGIYLASAEWLNKCYQGRVIVRCYCLRSELHKAGDKWRCKRLWVVCWRSM